MSTEYGQILYCRAAADECAKGTSLSYQHVCVLYLALGQSLDNPSEPVCGKADVVYHIAIAVAELMCESVTSEDVPVRHS